jgi:hypothetical protein
MAGSPSGVRHASCPRPRPRLQLFHARFRRARAERARLGARARRHASETGRRAVRIRLAVAPAHESGAGHRGRRQALQRPPVRHVAGGVGGREPPPRGDAAAGARHRRRETAGPGPDLLAAVRLRAGKRGRESGAVSVCRAADLAAGRRAHRIPPPGGADAAEDRQGLPRLPGPPARPAPLHRRRDRAARGGHGQRLDGAGGDAAHRAGPDPSAAREAAREPARRAVRGDPGRRAGRRTPGAGRGRPRRAGQGGRSRLRQARTVRAHPLRPGRAPEHRRHRAAGRRRLLRARRAHLYHHRHAAGRDPRARPARSGAHQGRHAGGDDAHRFSRARSPNSSSSSTAIRAFSTRTRRHCWTATARSSRAPTGSCRSSSPRWRRARSA